MRKTLFVVIVIVISKNNPIYMRRRRLDTVAPAVFLRITPTYMGRQKRKNRFN